MSSANSQGYLWIPCKFYSSLANQIMCNKQSALELDICSKRRTDGKPEGIDNVQENINLQYKNTVH